MEEEKTQQQESVQHDVEFSLDEMSEEELVVQWLLEEENMAIATERVKRIRHLLNERVPYGDSVTVYESPILGGQLEPPVTLIKKRFLPKRQYSDVAVINKLTDREKAILTRSETTVYLDRRAFEELLEKDATFASDFVDDVTWSPEDERVELQRKNAWLKSRGL